MTTTTTIKLPGDLKSRITRMAEAEGKPPDAFMVEALQAQKELAERRREFVESARLARQEVAEYGLVYDADEVFSYLALYDYDVVRETGLALAIRHQREQPN